MGWQWKTENKSGLPACRGHWRCACGNVQSGSQCKRCRIKWWQTHRSKVETSGKPRPSSDPPKPKPPRKVNQAEVTELGDYLWTIAQLANTVPVPKMPDPTLEGAGEMILETQSQLCTKESKVEQHNVMGHIRHRKDQH